MKITHAQERKLVTGILTTAKFPAEDADTISKVITHSDFTGVYSHGLSRLTRYIRQIEAGVLNPQPDFKTVLDDDTLLVVDGDNGSGIVSVNKAYDQALEKAKKFGVGIATGRHNANIGCGSYYGWRAAEDEMICVLCCNTYAFSAPYGGADRMIGTNPIIVSIPTGEEYPMVLDISTTNVAMGKIQAFEREGKPIPETWANDYDGKPTTDASKAYALTPIAFHKGYGLAVMVDALSTMLSGAAYGSDIGLFSKLEMENTGFFLMLLDPSRFMPIEEFHKTADRYIRMMKSSRKADGVEEIFMPGEIERRTFKKFMETGIEVSEKLQQELTDLCHGLGVPEDVDTFEKLLQYYEA